MNKIVKQTRAYNPPLEEKLSGNKENPEEENEAQVALNYLVTDSKGSVYAMTPLVPELFSALLKARYSRTELSAKQLLWREFIALKKDIDWEKILAGRVMLDEVFNYKRAEGVAERILLQYGDDSVFELGGAHLFMDRVSQVAAKVIEDTRIGLSPLEKSTRYVVFDQKDGNGDYSFFKDPKIMESSFKNLYLKTNRDCFEFYALAVDKLSDYFKKQVPIEAQEFPNLAKPSHPRVKFSVLKDDKSIKAARTAYNQSIKAKACDVARVILPASTFTNIGEFGNARAYGYLFTKMSASSLSEMQMIAGEGVRELKKVLPKFFDVVDSEHGKEYQKYLKKTEEILIKHAQDILKNKIPEMVERVELVTLDPNLEVNIAAALLYPYAKLPLRQIINIMKQAGPNLVSQIIHDSLKFRTNRRHKPPRAFEIAGYELIFDILGNFGIYRDLQRQRMLTQQHQAYTTDHGFDMPVEFTEIGLQKEFSKVMESMKKAHDKVAEVFPSESQYLMTLANYTRWYMGMNLREAFWLTELRSTPQGHFSYRTVAQDMYLKACQRYPILRELKAKQEQFVDMTDRSKNLERMEAMQRIQVKIAQIEEKYS